MRVLFFMAAVLLAFGCKSQKNPTASSAVSQENAASLKGTIQKDKNCKHTLIQSVSSSGDTLLLIAVSGLSGKEKEGSTVSFEYQALRMPQPQGCRGIPASITLKK
jgi:hypothetical protein